MKRVATAYDDSDDRDDDFCKTVRLLDVDGTEIGIFTWVDAYKLAVSRGQNLELIDSKVTPNVVQLSNTVETKDTERERFERAKRIRAAKKKLLLAYVREFKLRCTSDRYDYQRKLNKAKQADVREIKLRCKIEAQDYQRKLDKARDLLKKNLKVKVVIVLRGRELQNADLAIELANRFADEVKEFGTVEKMPELSGREVIMVLAPTR